MIPSPMRALVGQYLRPFHKARGVLDDMELTLAVFDAAQAAGAEAIAGCGVGLDHLAGERVLAACLLRETPRDVEHRVTCAITDRRTALSGWSSIAGPLSANDRRFSVLHREIARIDSKSSMLHHHVSLLTPQAKYDLRFPKITEMLAAFYGALLQYVPHEQRWEPPTPLVNPSAPAESLWMHDPHAYAMLHGAVRHGGDFAHDFLTRVVLAHRSRLGGPGMTDGMWISPMSARDLGQTLVRVFGAPMAHARPSPGYEQLDFYVDPQRDPLGDVAAGLGLAASIVFLSPRGIGRAIARAMTKKTPVTFVRVVFTDRKSHAGYQIFTQGGPLERFDSLMAHKLHQVLIAASYDVLARRIERGWDLDYYALFR
jgi:hypothetical protein